MKNVKTFGTGAALLAVLLIGLTAPAFADHERDKHFDKCAKACGDCQRECDSCFRHCADLVVKGSKDHAKSMNLCVDCGELCSTATKLSSRKSELAAPACEACAKACDVCADECEKFKDDKHVAACAKACRACAKECREMIEHAGHEKK